MRIDRATIAAQKKEISAKRQALSAAYSQHGFHSDQYQQGFDQLHDLNLALMANQFRLARGLGPYAKTPYC